VETMQMPSSNQHCLDIRGYFTPLSVLKVQLRLDGMASGEVLEVWLNDFDTEEDLKEILRVSANELVSVESQGEFDKIYIKRSDTE